MNFKIIETETKLPDVLLYRDRDEEGREIVVIHTVGTLEGDTNMFASEKIEFEYSEAAQDFIRDFSKMSAIKFCKRQNIKY